MSKFAKLFNSGGHQVLFYAEPSDEHDDKARLNQIVYYRGAVANVALDGIPYPNDDDEGFGWLIDKIEQEQADRLVSAVEGMIGS